MSSRSLRLLVSTSAAFFFVMVGSVSAGADASPQTAGSDVSVQPLAAVTSLPSGGPWAPAPATGPSPFLVSGNISAGGCTYQQANDDPHFSSTAGDVSMHAWWNFAGGVCPNSAKVTGGLQAYFCSSFGCGWVTVATNSGTYLPGGGSGRRATPRLTCASNAFIGWRGWTDVDLPNISDPPDVTYSTIVNLNCSPP